MPAVKAIDGFAVEYAGADANARFHFFRPLVKLNIFIAARDRFVGRFRKAQEGGSRSDTLRRLVLESSAKSPHALRDLAVALIKELIVRPSEQSDWWKSVWPSGGDYTKPKNEPEVHRDMFHILRPWFEVRRLTLDREVNAAGGSIDFLATGFNEDGPIKCGIEVKYAHNPHIIDGIAKQLPAYMNDLDAKAGLMVIFWCKGEKFEHPSAYASALDLEGTLKHYIAPVDDIKLLSVNAAFRPPPSQRTI
jgi:hypothetical protein